MGKEDAPVSPAMIEALVQSKVAEILAKREVSAGDFEKAMEAERANQAPPAKVTKVRCKSPLTGAFFWAKLMWSRGFPQGRCVDISEGYVWPDAAMKKRSEGGPRPDRDESEWSAEERQRYQHDLYWDFVRRDAAEYASGKPFNPYISIEKTAEREGVAAVSADPEYVKKAV